MVKLKRVYEPAAKGDGHRVLVDRLWPRGVKKEELADAEWMKELAPSHELRKAFGHDPARWKAFRTKYKEELREHQAELDSLARRAKKGNLTLLYSAKDEEHNNAVVIKEAIERKIARSG